MNFLEGGSNFTEDSLFGYFYVSFHRNPNENDFKSQRGGGGGYSEPHETPLEPPQECHTKKYCQGVLQPEEMSLTATNRGIARDCQNKSTAREYNNQKYCQGVPRLNYIQRVPQTKVPQLSATIEMIAKECKN